MSSNKKNSVTLNTILVGEQGIGKGCLLQRIEEGKYPSGGRSKSTEITEIDVGPIKNGKKHLCMRIKKVQPEVMHHGEGWKCEDLVKLLKEGLPDLEKDGKFVPIHGILFVVPCRTYKSNSQSVCGMASAKSWVKLFQDTCPKAPIVLVRTQFDLDKKDMPGDTELAFTEDMGFKLAQDSKNVVGSFSVSALEGTGCDDFIKTTGKMLFDNLPKGTCVVM